MFIPPDLDQSPRREYPSAMAENPSSVIVRSLDQTRFFALFTESPKQVRELIFERLAIQPKALPKTRFPKPGAKNEARMLALFEFLQGTDDEQVADELLRNYFLKRRGILGAALDHLGIPHEEGLTNDELDKFEKLSVAEGEKLFKAVSEKHDANDVELYLRYMKVAGFSGKKTKKAS